jgi:uncharacterized membrane protein
MPSSIRVKSSLWRYLLRQSYQNSIPLIGVPMIYAVVTLVCGIVFPRMEFYYLGHYRHGMSVAVATAAFSAVASGMLPLTAIVFSLAFVMVQFSSSAYSPRLVLWLSRAPIIWHALGIFTATFLFAIVALGWVDRNGSGQVPFFSTWVVILLLIASVLVLARLVQRLMFLQVTEVLYFISQKGAQVVGATYPPLAGIGPTRSDHDQSPKLPLAVPLVTQTVTYTGAPLAIAAYDMPALVSLAKQVGGVIILSYAVGDTVLEGDTLLSVTDGQFALPEAALRRALQLQRERTFEQDPKYALRLLVDIAIKALSPAINDPTTAVQALDHIEDLLRRLASRRLDVGQVQDGDETLRLIFPTPTWGDFLMLAFDEIRFCGATSLQVMRRLRTALFDLARLAPPDKREVVQRYIAHLDTTVKAAITDPEDQRETLQWDRQGLGLSRQPPLR